MLHALAFLAPVFSIATFFQMIVLIIVAAILIVCLNKAISLLPDPYKGWASIVAYIFIGLIVCYYLLRWAGMAG